MASKKATAPHIGDGKKYSCANCCLEITENAFVQCGQCKELFLCVECFRDGACLGEHLPTHSYILRETDPSDILSIAEDDLQMLKVIEKAGCGNWTGVHKELKTKTAAQIKERFLTHYVNRHLGRVWSKFQRPTLIDYTEGFEDEAAAADADIGLQLTMPPQEKIKALGISAKQARLIGYSVNREEFTDFYDVEAEALLTDVSNTADDGDEVSRQCKLTKLDMYQSRLRERKRRERVVVEHRLLSEFSSNQAASSSKRAHTVVSSEQIELENKLKAFKQYCTRFEYENLIGSLQHQRQLQQHYRELKRYRMNGVKTVRDCFHMETHAKDIKPDPRTKPCIVKLRELKLPGFVRDAASTVIPPGKKIKAGVNAKDDKKPTKASNRTKKIR